MPMDIRFKGLQYEIPQVISDRAEKKLKAVEKYIDSGSVASAYVELGRETDAHQSGRVWQSLINLTIDGQLFRAEATEESIENAIDRSVEDLAREVRRSKKKGESLLRRGGATLKRLMRRA